MIFSGKREELIAQVGKLEGINELLLLQLEEARKDKAALQAQVAELQNALVAKAAPEYYRDTRATTLLSDPSWAEEAKRQQETNQVLSDYARLIESDSLISSKDDLEMIFLKGMRNIDGPASPTPENSES